MSNLRRYVEIPSRCYDIFSEDVLVVNLSCLMNNFVAFIVVIVLDLSRKCDMSSGCYVQSVKFDQ